MKKIYILICILILIGCTNELRYYQKALNQNLINTDSTQILVIIPSIGCLGCISGVESYLKYHAKEEQDIKFILTNIQSIKTLRLRIGEAINSKNIYLDRENIWYNPKNENSIYPILLRIASNQVIAIEYISPENPHSMETIIKRWRETANMQ